MTAAYVAGFLFDDKLENVTLIKKKRPAWQAGHWNGIGGHIEVGELDLHAMSREFFEETGAKNVWNPWIRFTSLSGSGARHHSTSEPWSVAMFYAVDSELQAKVTTTTDEEVRTFSVAGILSGTVQDLAGPTVGNVKWLIQMAVAMARGEDICRCFDIQEVERYAR